MLMGCCHCGDEPPSESDSIPPSESTPPSESASDSESSQSESGSSYSESIVDIDCVNVFGCEAIPRFLRWEVEVTKPADACPCTYLSGGTFKLEFFDCTTFMPSGVRALRYKTVEVKPLKHPVFNFFCVDRPPSPLFADALWTADFTDNTDTGTLNLVVRAGQVTLSPSYTFEQQFGARINKANCLFDSNTLVPIANPTVVCGFTDGVLSPW
jgi:hypothetical protein